MYLVKRKRFTLTTITLYRELKGIFETFCTSLCMSEVEISTFDIYTYFRPHFTNQMFVPMCHLPVPPVYQFRTKQPTNSKGCFLG